MLPALILFLCAVLFGGIFTYLRNDADEGDADWRHSHRDIHEGDE